jgi:hypothetical protein
LYINKDIIFSLNNYFFLQKYDKLSSSELLKIKQEYSTNDFYSQDRPEAICQAKQRLVSIDNYFYDRKAPTCCVPWHIKKGDIYTVIAFNPKLAYKLGPHTDKIPKTFPAHVSLWMSWENEDTPATSHFGIINLNRVPSGAVNNNGFTNQQKFAFILNKGTLNNYNIMFHEQFLLSFIIASAIKHPFLLMLLTAILILLLLKKCCCKKTSFPGDKEENCKYV